MNSALRFRVFVLGCVWLCFPSFAFPQSLEPRWKHDFPKEINWYVRTSTGILLVRWGKTLTAVDGVDGRQLWELTNIEPSTFYDRDTAESARGKNLLEVPALGIVLLNRVKLAADAEGKLIALNLDTGQRL